MRLKAGKNVYSVPRDIDPYAACIVRGSIYYNMQHVTEREMAVLPKITGMPQYWCFLPHVKSPCIQVSPKPEKAWRILIEANKRVMI